MMTGGTPILGNLHMSNEKLHHQSGILSWFWMLLNTLANWPIQKVFTVSDGLQLYSLATTELFNGSQN